MVLPLTKSAATCSWIGAVSRVAQAPLRGAESKELDLGQGKHMKHSISETVLNLCGDKFDGGGGPNCVDNSSRNPLLK